MDKSENMREGERKRIEKRERVREDKEGEEKRDSYSLVRAQINKANEKNKFRDFPKN